MSQHHAKGHLAAAGVGLLWAGPGKFRQDLIQRLVELERPAFVEDHAGGGGGYNFGDRSKIIDGFRLDTGRVKVIGEASHGLERDQFAAIGDGQRRSRRGEPVYGAAEKKKRAIELFVLAAE